MPFKATPYVQQRVESHVEAEDISLSEMNTESPLRHTLPCLSKRRDLCSMIDFIKKKENLAQFPRFAFGTNCQITVKSS